jgi:hypothetical protein
MTTNYIAASLVYVCVHDSLVIAALRCAALRCAALLLIVVRVPAFIHRSRQEERAWCGGGQLRVDKAGGLSYARACLLWRPDQTSQHDGMYIIQSRVAVLNSESLLWKCIHNSE